MKFLVTAGNALTSEVEESVRTRTTTIREARKRNPISYSGRTSGTITTGLSVGAVDVLAATSVRKDGTSAYGATTTDLGTKPVAIASAARVTTRDTPITASFDLGIVEGSGGTTACGEANGKLVVIDSLNSAATNITADLSADVEGITSTTSTVGTTTIDLAVTTGFGARVIKLSVTISTKTASGTSGVGSGDGKNLSTTAHLIGNVKANATAAATTARATNRDNTKVA